MWQDSHSALSSTTEVEATFRERVEDIGFCNWQTRSFRRPSGGICRGLGQVWYWVRVGGVWICMGTRNDLGPVVPKRFRAWLDQLWCFLRTA